ncbi:hypothetical protein M758_9G093900 [Ceratodon purpureus]|nr:hypothetical protein M758_9G093900 [Ceratodon purpureus]
MQLDKDTKPCSKLLPQAHASSTIKHIRAHQTRQGHQTSQASKPFGRGIRNWKPNLYMNEKILEGTNLKVLDFDTFVQNSFHNKHGGYKRSQGTTKEAPTQAYYITTKT